jgi:hypothetical protein
MVMQNKHMVDGDGVGDDGDEEALEIPLPGVESRIQQPPKMKIVMVVALWVSKNFVLLGNRVLGYINGHGWHGIPTGPCHCLDASYIPL